METITREMFYKRKNKGKEPESPTLEHSPLSSTQEKPVFAQWNETATPPGIDHLCFRHYSLNYQAYAVPQKLREGNCMCCYVHKTHTPEFFTVSNGIVDRNMAPLLLPSTTPHATGVICQKHFMRNADLYEIYKKSHNLRLDCGAYMQPKSDKGEDAYFVDEGGRFMGLADGVGGWAQYDVDPSEFPEKLMEEAHKILLEGKQNDLVEVVYAAFENSRQVVGSSTVVMALLDKNDTLRTFNLGDSGFRIIRDFQVLYASREQQHAPNKPYQLGTSCEDTPEKGVVEHIKLRAGDLLVFGSDGLFDNLFDREIIDIIRNAHHLDTKKLANQIAHAAFLVSIDKHAYSPYAAWIRSLGNPEWSEVLGGKKDDITVLVARVVQRIPPSHEASLNHFQNTAMSFSIDSPSLSHLLAQMKWDSQRSLSPPAPPLRTSSDSLASIPMRAIRTEGREGVGARGAEEGREKLRNRSISASGYFSHQKAPPRSAFMEPDHKLLPQQQQSRNTGAKSNSLINSWADVVAARGGFLRHRRANSANLRELAQSNLLNQVTEQLNTAPDPAALHNSATFSPSSPAPAPDDSPIVRSVSLPVRRSSHDASSPVHMPSFSTTPPSPSMSSASLLSSSPLTSSLSPRSPLSSSASPRTMPSYTPLSSPPGSSPTTPRAAHGSSPLGHENGANTSPRMTVARRFLARDNLSRAVSTSLPNLDAELVAARPTLRENCTEQDYFEYMVATREFEVFVNLHRNSRITILPYFI